MDGNDELRKRYEYSPWLFWPEASEPLKEAQRELQARLAATDLISFGRDCFVAWSAVLDPPEHLSLGDRTIIGAHVQLMGRITIGPDCSINAHSDVRGLVAFGSGVRMGAHSSVLAFNHQMAPERPIHRQGSTEEGIRVGDDVWIGSHVIILDGVTVGDHAVIGAGAVVTRDVPDWAIVGGNPARFIRDRRHEDSSRHGPARLALGERLEALADRIRHEVGPILERHEVGDPSARYPFADTVGGPPTLRAWCDAIEIGAMLGVDQLPGQNRTWSLEALASLQDAETGALPPAHDDPSTPRLPNLPAVDLDAAYSPLCVGAALELLGGNLRQPVRALTDLGPIDLVRILDTMPWRTNAWMVGGWLDAYGTCLQSVMHSPMGKTALAVLLGWLTARCDPLTGMWGGWSGSERRRQLVNGFYRIVRCTYARYGLPVPHPEAAIDTALAHAEDARWFDPAFGGACDVLDVAHTLWWCGQWTGHRRDEAAQWSLGQLDRIAHAWRTDEGLSFTLGSGSAPEDRPSLMGIEMWLAAAWYLADLNGLRSHLGYAPRGIHRPDAQPLPWRPLPEGDQ